MKTKVINIIIIFLVSVSSIFSIYLRTHIITYYNSAIDIMKNNVGNIDAHYGFLTNNTLETLGFIFPILFFIAFILYVLKSKSCAYDKKFIYTIIPIIVAKIILNSYVFFVETPDTTIALFSILAEYAVFISLIVFFFFELDLYEKLSKIILIIAFLIGVVCRIIQPFNSTVISYLDYESDLTVALQFGSFIHGVLILVDLLLITFAVIKTINLRYDY